MHKKIKLIFASDGLLQSVKTLFGSTFATGISAIALMIYSRVLGPEKFGEFSVGFAVVMILTKINDLGFNNAILRYGSENEKTEEKNFIYSFTLKYKLLISFFIILIGIFFSGAISKVFNFSDPLIILVALTIGISTVYYEHLLNTLQSLQRFNQAIFINIIQAITKLVWALALLITGITSSLITFTWYIAAPLVPVLFWKKFVTKDTRINFKIHNSKLQSKILMLAKHSAVGLIATGFIDNIDVLYLQKYLSSYEVGLYSGVSRIAMLFALIAYSLGNVLFPRVAKYKNKEDLNAFIKKAFTIAILSIIGFILFLPFGKLSILLTIGSEYISGLNILYLLTASSFIAVAVVPFIALFFSFKANWYFSVSGILQLVVVLIGNTIFVPEYGLEAAAWTRIVSRVVLLVFTLITSMILYRKTYKLKL
ncbi:MAG: oligosaccharide flippase family protein [Pseudomonadales bacterium]|nr:oligosaccharide flippase family protein [Pseudomonadales bacterium]